MWIFFRSFNIFHDSEKPPIYTALLKERVVQTERQLTNLSQGNVHHKDSSIKAPKSPQKTNSSRGNKQKTKALLDLEKIFKIKRQNNSTTDLRASGNSTQKIQRPHGNGSESYTSPDVNLVLIDYHFNCSIVCIAGKAHTRTLFRKERSGSNFLSLTNLQVLK